MDWEKALLGFTKASQQGPTMTDSKYKQPLRIEFEIELHLLCTNSQMMILSS
jgi:hypothetical protein